MLLDTFCFHILHANMTGLSQQTGYDLQISKEHVTCSSVDTWLASPKIIGV